MRFALAGSALLHGLGASMPVPQPPAGGAREPLSIVLAARIDSATVPAHPVTVPTVPPEPEKLASPSRRSLGSPGPTAAPRPDPDERGPSIMPQPDPVVYPAGELDQLPAPARPLELSRLRHGAATASTVTLELVIDEHGLVHDASLAGRAAGVAFERELLGVLSTTAFVPARKDGRAVKSRITLSVNLEAGKAPD